MVKTFIFRYLKKAKSIKEIKKCHAKVKLGSAESSSSQVLGLFALFLYCNCIDVAYTQFDIPLENNQNLGFPFQVPIGQLQPILNGFFPNQILESSDNEYNDVNPIHNNLEDTQAVNNNEEDLENTDIDLPTFDDLFNSNNEISDHIVNSEGENDLNSSADTISTNIKDFNTDYLSNYNNINDNFQSVQNVDTLKQDFDKNLYELQNNTPQDIIEKNNNFYNTDEKEENIEQNSYKDRHNTSKVSLVDNNNYDSQQIDIQSNIDLSNDEESKNHWIQKYIEKNNEKVNQSESDSKSKLENKELNESSIANITYENGNEQKPNNNDDINHEGHIKKFDLNAENYTLSNEADDKNSNHFNHDLENINEGAFGANFSDSKQVLIPNEDSTLQNLFQENYLSLNNQDENNTTSVPVDLAKENIDKTDEKNFANAQNAPKLISSQSLEFIEDIFKEIQATGNDIEDEKSSNKQSSDSDSDSIDVDVLNTDSIEIDSLGEDEENVDKNNKSESEENKSKLNDGDNNIEHISADLSQRRICQFHNGTLWPTATTCDDDLGKDACKSIFGNGKPRSVLCYNTGMAHLAQQCAYTCKTCCEKNNFDFDCVDSAVDIIDCAKHRAKCYDPVWHNVMMKTCEHTCGFCSADKCFDAAEGCNSLKPLCNHDLFKDVMRHQCALTCKRCKPGVTKKSDFTFSKQSSSSEIADTDTDSIEKCVDRAPACALQRKLCDDTRYTVIMTEKCAKTCNFCNDLSKNSDLSQNKRITKSGTNKDEIYQSTSSEKDISKQFTLSGELIENSISDDKSLDSAEEISFIKGINKKILTTLQKSKESYSKPKSSIKKTENINVEDIDSTQTSEQDKSLFNNFKKELKNIIDNNNDEKPNNINNTSIANKKPLNFNKLETSNNVNEFNKSDNAESLKAIDERRKKKDNSIKSEKKQENKLYSLEEYKEFLNKKRESKTNAKQNKSKLSSKRSKEDNYSNNDKNDNEESGDIDIYDNDESGRIHQDDKIKKTQELNIDFKDRKVNQVQSNVGRNTKDKNNIKSTDEGLLIGNGDNERNESNKSNDNEQEIYFKSSAQNYEKYKSIRDSKSGNNEESLERNIVNKKNNESRNDEIEETNELNSNVELESNSKSSSEDVGERNRKNQKNQKLKLKAKKKKSKRKASKAKRRRGNAQIKKNNLNSLSENDSSEISVNRKSESSLKTLNLKKSKLKKHKQRKNQSKEKRNQEKQSREKVKNESGGNVSSAENRRKKEKYNDDVSTSVNILNLVSGQTSFESTDISKLQKNKFDGTTQPTSKTVSNNAKRTSRNGKSTTNSKSKKKVQNDTFLNKNKEQNKNSTTFDQTANGNIEQVQDLNLKELYKILENTTSKGSRNVIVIQQRENDNSISIKNDLEKITEELKKRKSKKTKKEKDNKSFFHKPDEESKTLDSEGINKTQIVKSQNKNVEGDDKTISTSKIIIITNENNNKKAEKLEQEKPKINIEKPNLEKTKTKKEILKKKRKNQKIRRQTIQKISESLKGLFNSASDSKPAKRNKKSKSTRSKRSINYIPDNTGNENSGNISLNYDNTNIYNSQGAPSLPTNEDTTSEIRDETSYYDEFQEPESSELGKFEDFMASYDSANKLDENPANDFESNKYLYTSEEPISFDASVDSLTANGDEQIQQSINNYILQGDSSAPKEISIIRQDQTISPSIKPKKDDNKLVSSNLNNQAFSYTQKLSNQDEQRKNYNQFNVFPNINSAKDDNYAINNPVIDGFKKENFVKNINNPAKKTAATIRINDGNSETTGKVNIFSDALEVRNQNLNKDTSLSNKTNLEKVNNHTIKNEAKNNNNDKLGFENDDNDKEQEEKEEEDDEVKDDEGEEEEIDEEEEINDEVDEPYNDPLEEYFQQYQPILNTNNVDGLTNLESKFFLQAGLTPPIRNDETFNYAAATRPQIRDGKSLESNERFKDSIISREKQSKKTSAGDSRSSSGNKEHKFDGVLRDRRGKRFNKSELDVESAIRKIEREYGVNYKFHNEPNQKQNPQPRRLSESSSESGGDESSILSRERQITKELKEILRDLTLLKKSRYRDRDDRSNEDLRKFLISQQKRRRRQNIKLKKKPKRRIKKKLVVIPSSELDDQDESASDSDFESIEQVRRKRPKKTKKKRVVLLENVERRQPATILAPARRYLVDRTPSRVLYETNYNDRYPATIVRSNTPDGIAFGPSTPTKYSGGNRVPVAGSEGPIVLAPRVTPGNIDQPINSEIKKKGLLNTGGFTHVDVGAGFGPIPADLCKDYYPYCEQITPSGFCASGFYPLKMKREFCPESCGLC